MSDIRCGDLMLPEKGFFKRKDAEEPVDDAPHGFDPAFTPRPDLGGHQVDDGNTSAPELGGNAEMKIGGIGKDGEGGTAGETFRNQPPVAPPDSGQVPYDLDNSHDRQVFGANDRVDTRSAKPGSRAAKKTARRPPFLQMGHQFGGVVVSGSFTCRDQDGFGSTGQASG